MRSTELLNACGIDDIDSLVERLIAVRRFLGKPTGRWRSTASLLRPSYRFCEAGRRLATLGVRRTGYTREARPQLEAECLPATRATVSQRACKWLDEEEESAVLAGS